MTKGRVVAVISALLTTQSCTRTTASSPQPSPSAGPAASAGAGQRGAGPAGPRRVPPSRDSLAKLRAELRRAGHGQIAGRENQPAEEVFKNVQVLKGITAAQLVHKMDKDVRRWQ